MWNSKNLGRVPSENNPCNHMQALKRKKWFLEKVQFWGMFGPSKPFYFMPGKSFGVCRTNFVS